MHIPWSFITRFGDSAVLLPLAALFALALWRYESRRSAWCFLGALFACMLSLVALKLLFLSYGHTWYDRLESPSGHAGLSVMVYGALVLVLAGHLRRHHEARISTAMAAGAALTAGAMLVLAIAASRKMLGAHSLAEILLGISVGAACLWKFWRDWRGLEHGAMPVWPVYGALASVALLAVLMHQTRFSPERQIWRMAAHIRAQLRTSELGPSPVLRPGPLQPGDSM